MDPKLKTFLILVVFIVIIIILFRPFQASCGTESNSRLNNNTKKSKEHYTDSFTGIVIDDLPYAQDVHVNNDGVVNMYGQQIYDHIDAQNEALEYKQVHDINSADQKQAQKQGQEQIQSEKHVRFSDDVFASKPYVNNTNHKTSHSRSDIYKDRILESNNISNYCVNSSAGDEDAYPNVYADTINECMNIDSTENMDMDDKEYYDMMSGRSDIKTYIQIDQSSGKYDQKQNKGDQDINNLRDLTDVINNYRDNTLNSISGSYKGANTFQDGKVQMYDRV